MDKLVLSNNELYPSAKVLQEALGESFMAFESLCNDLIPHNIIPEWNYYNDGKAWLCKLLFKKKNLAWLGVYSGYFVVTCYFTERHLEKIADLDISEPVKETFCIANPIGRLLPMSITIDTANLSADVLTMILFKKGL